HVVDLGYFHARILDRDAAWLDGAFDQFLDKCFQLGAGDLQVQVLGTGGVRRDVWQVDLGLLRRGQFDLGFLGRFLQALQCQHVFGKIDTAFFLELANDVIDDALIEVFAAQEGVAIGGEHFELLFAIDIGDFDDGDVEGTATQIVDGDFAIALFGLVHAEGQRGSRRLVDDALDVQSGDTAGVFRGLALAVVEIGGNGNDGLGDFFTQVVFRGLLHFAQHIGRHLGRRQLLALRFDPCVAVVGLYDAIRHQVYVFLHRFFVKFAAYETLDGIQRVLRIGNGLTLCRRPNQDFTVLHVRNNGRR